MKTKVEIIVEYAFIYSPYILQVSSAILSESKWPKMLSDYSEGVAVRLFTHRNLAP